MSDIINKIKERYNINKTSSVFFITGTFFTLFTLYLMNTMANISSFWSLDLEENPPLPDFIHEVIEVKKDLTPIVDLIMNGIIFFTIICMLVPRNALKIYFRFFIVTIVSYFLRMSLVSITNMPSPNLNCIKVVDNFFTHFGYNRCGDLMFSGHTLMTFICVLVWVDYSLLSDIINMKIDVFIRYIIFLSGITVIFLIIINRSHYTIDVILSIYCTGGVWIIFGQLWDRYLSKEEIFKCFIIE